MWPRLIVGLAIAGVIGWSYKFAYNQGQASVRAEWQDQVDEIKRKAIEEASKDAKTTVKVITKYVERTKEIDWNTASGRHKLEQLCSESLREPEQLSGSTGSTDSRPSARATRDALADEVAQCIDTANRLEAIIEYDTEKKNRSRLSGRSSR